MQSDADIVVVAVRIDVVPNALYGAVVEIAQSPELMAQVIAINF